MTSAPATSRRIDGLQALRALAIALVLLRHAAPDVFGGAGIVGVVLFFGLSGYLITGVLMRDIRRSGRIRYGHFYRNRILRLVPALLVLLVGYTIVTMTLDPLDESQGIVRTLAVAITYTMNVPHFGASEAMTHLWTLACEEQFYILWPVVLLVGVRVGRLRLVVVGAAVASYLLTAATIVALSPDINPVYTLPWTWAPVMAMGAAASLRKEALSRRLPTATGPKWTLTGLALVILAGISMIPEAKSNPASYLLLGPVVGACTVVLIFHARQHADLSGPAWRVVVGLGTISYAVYLWNFPIVKWLAPDGEPSVLVGSSAAALAVLAGIASWVLVEKRVALYKERLDVPRAPAIV